MSYTPPDQYLRPGATKIVDGVDEFVEAAGKRQRNQREWNEDHLRELSKLSADLILLRDRLLAFMDGVS